MGIKDAKRSLDFAVIGIGEGGGRIAAQFAKYGYTAAAINTASQDLTQLTTIPTKNRLHIGGDIGGAGQDMAMGASAFETASRKIAEFIEVIAGHSHYAMIVAGAGGGTGSGGFDFICRVASKIKPTAGILTIPHDFEGPTVKANAVRVLKAANALVSEEVVGPLMILDNQRILEIFPDVSLTHLWSASNSLICETWDAFNRISTRSGGAFANMDGMDYARLLETGGYLSIGVTEIGENDLDIAQAIRENIHGGLLANGFDLTTARAAAAIIVGSQTALDRIPAVNILSAFETLKELTNSADLFRGVYPQDRASKVRLYTLMSGLAMPRDRIGAFVDDARQELERAGGKVGYDTDLFDGFGAQVGKRKRSAFARGLK